MQSGRSPGENSPVDCCHVSPRGFPVKAPGSSLQAAPPSNSESIGLAPPSGLADVLRLGPGLEDVCLVPSPRADWSVCCFWAEPPGTVSTLLFTGRVVDASAKVPCSAARANCAARSAFALLSHGLPRGTAHTFRTPALPPPALLRTPRRVRAWYGPRRLLRS